MLLGLAEGALLFQEEMSGETVVSTAVPAATTRTTSFKSGSPSSKYVKLNIGGALYYTTMQTLTKQDTMLKAMFSGRMEVLTDSEGEAPGEGRGPGASSARGALGVKRLLAALRNSLPRLQNCSAEVALLWALLPQETGAHKPIPRHACCPWLRVLTCSCLMRSRSHSGFSGREVCQLPARFL